MATTQRTDNGRAEKHYDFTPIDHDSNQIEPDAAAGEYEAVVDDAKIIATSKDKYPMLVIEWKLESTNTDTPEAEKSVGAIVSDFLAFFPDGDRRGNFPKRRFRQLRELLNLPEDILPTRMESKEDFAELLAALKDQQTTLWVTTREDKETHETRANVQYTAPRGSMGAMPSDGDDEEQEEERKPARRAAPTPSRKPGKPAARRR
jgi:hypothetical protein